MNTDKTKTMKIRPETHNALLDLGKKGDTFDDIIMRLLEEHQLLKKNMRTDT